MKILQRHFEVAVLGTTAMRDAIQHTLDSSRIVVDLSLYSQRAESCLGPGCTGDRRRSQ